MDRFYINNTLLVNKLKQKGEMLEANKEHTSVVFREKKENICIYYSIERDENIKPLNMLDFLILDFAYSVYMDYDDYGGKFSVRQFIHAVMGTDKACSQKRIEKFTEEIEKLRNTRITIDYSEEMKSRYFKDDDYEEDEENSYKIESVPLLPLEKIGKNKYEFISKPPLYTYAEEANRQILSVPTELFYCRNVVKNTERNFLIKYALLHELEVMRYVTTGNGRFKKWNVNKDIMYFKKSRRPSEADSGLLTQIDWCLDESESDVIKSRSDIEDKIRTVVGLHTVKDITETIRKLFDEYYKNIDYIKSYEFLRRKEKGAVIGIKIKGRIENL